MKIEKQKERKTLSVKLIPNWVKEKLWKGIFFVMDKTEDNTSTECQKSFPLY